MNETHRLAIVGGGSVAVSFLAQFIVLIQKTPIDFPPIHITLFEPTGVIGQGTAYQADLNTNLLNVPANNMSLFDDKRTHFLEWLTTLSKDDLSRYGVKEIDGNDFYPRPLFGRYVSEQFTRIVKLACDLGVTVRVIENAVVAIERQQSRAMMLRDSAGGKYEADRVVLCNGNLSSDKFEALLPQAGFLNSPYPVAELARKIPNSASVGILGSNLSAIDAIVALVAQGHAGPIHCFSRQGRLPSVRSTFPTKVSDRLTRNSVHKWVTEQDGHLDLACIYEQLQKMILSHGYGDDLKDLLGADNSASDQLDWEIETSQARQRPWQSVLASTNDVIDLLWFYLAPEEKQQFQKRWMPQWMSRRAMFPMKNALKLQELMRRRQLYVHGGFQACMPVKDKDVFEVSYENGVGDVESVRCEYIINATGFSQNVEKSADPLVMDLLNSGMATSSPYGGFKLDFNTGSLIASNSEIVDEITVLGSLARGTYFWTISMDVNARLAGEQARQIVNALVVQGDKINVC
ncbi:FAD/NAD(P)-binding protein [Advenella mimigardefordensis]|uniref:Putative FAD/NAD(P)-binding domain-containing protein n=1 Tax=Advenella mimigardefordensis (strain DSM 17166 / LMG 22922 / DPN7) TaxID=1247726 RepID=W0PCX1_ADVMD|nr:FAD/NAD(P)-binding protein [Advenella mimigardefordensis]AHG64714.1 putative FAD/NAD(P)-binding domain-containing protein [Advenella mimigardefordensis DPN7]